MFAVLALIAAVPLELELSGGPISTLDVGPGAPALMARVAVDLLDHLSLGASLLGVTGGEPQRTSCGSPCRGNASFQAISGLASLRLHTAGPLQAWLEGGAGIGHLISLSGDDLFEAPPIRGRSGPAFLIGIGLRKALTPVIAFGGQLAWTKWTNCEQAAHQYGASSIPASSGFGQSAGMLLFSVTFTMPR